ncbi:glycosyltransferase family 2 protein [Planktomarina temperata]|nr:glycosyltransferase family 2 protein [Planktomarina temperata]
MKSKIIVIILTKNEERHLERAILSVKSFANKILVIDSGSEDKTVQIAKKLGAQVISNPWVNYSTQFNFALQKVDNKYDWAFRLDADEYVTDQLQSQILDSIDHVQQNINGIYISRFMNFIGAPVKYGGLFPLHVLRIFRPRSGKCETRWMDEHILVDGSTTKFNGAIIDDNLNSLSWWIDKHNGYASREALDILNKEYKIFAQDNLVSIERGSQASKKRWIKTNIYLKLPKGIRSFVYFLYRYIFRLGFLDNHQGRKFHILQGLWYRYLVDCKVQETQEYMRKNKVPLKEAVINVLGIDLDA